MKKWSNPLFLRVFFPKNHSISSCSLILWSLRTAWAGINALGLATLSCTMLILNYHSNLPGAEWNSSAQGVVAALLLLFFRAKFPTDQLKKCETHLGVLLFFPKCQFLSETQSTGTNNILKFSESLRIPLGLEKPSEIFKPTPGATACFEHLIKLEIFHNSQQNTFGKPCSPGGSGIITAALLF